MSGKLQSAGINALGFLGLNTQESEVTLENGYATVANNCIIDRFGRIGSRRGWSYLTENEGTLTSTQAIKTIFEFKDVQGNLEILSAGNGKFFTGTSTLVEKKLRNGADNADISLTVTLDNWQVSSLPKGAGSTAEAEAFWAQRGQPLVVYNEGVSSRVFRRVGDVGSVPSGLTTDNFDPNCILSAYGRIWVADLTLDKHTIYYSQLLQGTHFTGSGSGLLNISSVVGNNDDIVALSSHNGFLVVFCKNNIVIYGNAQTPTSLQLVDVITGVGCIARDSVQNTGTDLLFLSKSGVRSLARTIQEKSTPMRELSINIRDVLVDDIQNESLENIKSIYFERDAFYLLSLPSTNIIYCFDIRTSLPNGGARITTWSGVSYKAFCATESRELYLGVLGGIARYRGYLDNNETYHMSYYTANADFGASSILKLIKKSRFVVIGNETQDFIIKYAFDYSSRFYSRVFYSNESSIPAEYNIAEYGVGEYTGGVVISTVEVNLGGSGKVVKFGVEAVINNAPVSIQKAELFFKLGKSS